MGIEKRFARCEGRFSQQPDEFARSEGREAVRREDIETFSEVAAASGSRPHKNTEFDIHRHSAAERRKGA